MPQPAQSAPAQARLSLFESEPSSPSACKPTRHPWALLLKRVFLADVSVCPVPACGGAMRLVEFASGGEHLACVLADLGLAPRPPTRPARIPARQLALPLI